MIIQEFNNQVTFEEAADLPVTEMLRVGNALDSVKRS
jgi:hypothetical protein